MSEEPNPTFAWKLSGEQGKRLFTVIPKLIGSAVIKGMSIQLQRMNAPASYICRVMTEKTMTVPKRITCSAAWHRISVLISSFSRGISSISLAEVLSQLLVRHWRTRSIYNVAVVGLFFFPGLSKVSIANYLSPISFYPLFSTRILRVICNSTLLITYHPLNFVSQ